MSAIYGSTRHDEKREFWQFIKNYGKDLTQPWLILGDMNGMLSSSDQSGIGPSPSSVQVLRKAMNSLELIDLGSSGGRYTWCNRRFSAVGGCSWVHLDRALSYPEWRALFPQATVQNLVSANSDYYPVLVNRMGSNYNLFHPFRFEAA
ncbi:uncharacterized protein LOC112090997 [Morus notabilis]|uniref:uncharacterized protein LOC112090997 n=1 Tax=Morus notabilis TaxID=981085 RepID=UPI000CED1467|nr:uncharacterized protein LOC112090997 [Morus notabilis]